jgi:hypothetical protein
MNTPVAVLAAVALLIVLALAGRSWLRSQRAPEAPAAPPAADPAPPPAAATDASPDPSAPPPAAPPVQEVPPPATTPRPPVTTPATSTATPRTQTSRGAAAPAPTRGAAPPTVTAPPPAAADSGRASGAGDPVKPAGVEAGKAAPAVPPVDDSLVAFSNVKYLAVNGRRTSDRDVLVNFGGGQVTVLSRDGGGAILAMPYGSIRRATYVSARDPRWDTSLAGPPDDVEVGSFIRQSRHWLVLQTGEAFAILRLDDQRNVPRFLDMLETRTGLKIDRPGLQTPAAAIDSARGTRRTTS